MTISNQSWDSIKSQLEHVLSEDNNLTDVIIKLSIKEPRNQNVITLQGRVFDEY